MAYLQTIRRTAGGTGVLLQSTYEEFTISAPYTSGDLIGPLAHAPYYGQNGMMVWFQQNFSNPVADWGLDAGNNFHLNFSFNPATDYPETGSVVVTVWYQYAA